jgi:hypothetical protein
MRRLLLGVSACFLMVVVWPGVFYLATSPYGSFWLLSIVELAVFGLAWLSLPTVVVSVGMLFFPRTRVHGLTLLAACLLLWPSMGVAAHSRMKLRDARFHAFAVRAQPLVDALCAFERANGRPPKMLTELVPAQLPSIPTTGMGAFPTFQYSDGGLPNDEGRWRLLVSTGALPWDWQSLEYRPSQDYPGLMARYGSWGWVGD